MFGKIVGAGQAGFVFENPKNPDSYFKIVVLPEQPLETMPLRSTKARLGAINQNQAELFFRLYQENLDIPQLPKVLAFYTGRVTPKLRRNLLNAASEDVRTCKIWFVISEPTKRLLFGKWNAYPV